MEKSYEIEPNATCTCRWDPPVLMRDALRHAATCCWFQLTISLIRKARRYFPYEAEEIAVEALQNAYVGRTRNSNSGNADQIASKEKKPPRRFGCVFGGTSDQPLEPYLKVVVRNRCIDELRRRHRAKTLTADLTDPSEETWEVALSDDELLPTRIESVISFLKTQKDNFGERVVGRREWNTLMLEIPSLSDRWQQLQETLEPFNDVSIYEKCTDGRYTDIRRAREKLASSMATSGLGEEEHAFVAILFSISSSLLKKTTKLETFELRSDIREQIRDFFTMARVAIANQHDGARYWNELIASIAFDRWRLNGPPFEPMDDETAGKHDKKNKPWGARKAIRDLMKQQLLSSELKDAIDQIIFPTKLGGK